MTERNSRPRVSVIVPAFNAGPFIRETLEHALAQTYPNIEILVIDDGSTDNTAEIVESFGERVRLICTENQGVAKARNAGIDAASGEFLAFLDADDLWEPEKIACQVEAIDADHRLIYTDTISFGVESLSNLSISANESLPSGDIRENLIQRNFITTSAVLLDRKIATRVGGFDSEIPVCDDWDYWLRALNHTKARFVAQPLVRYRIHDKSLGSKTGERIVGSIKVIDSGLKALDMPPHESGKIRRQAIAECYGYAATLARSEYRTPLAIKLFILAFRHHPSWGLAKEILKTVIGPRLLRRIKPGFTV